VVRGLVVHDHMAFGRPHLQLFGPGDLIDPRALGDVGCTWRALVASTVAVIDARLLAATRRWPQLFGALTSRIFDSQHEQHTLAGMAMLPRVEDRLLTLLCHLAERWGQVTPHGVALQLPMTHEMLGRMVGARRPTVSLAITDLTARNRLRRLDDGRWLLPLSVVASAMPAGTAAISAMA
jgi:CRP/FNR family cyclic AMP-dependent transcriptional regulator